MKFLADENFNNRIIRGLLRRMPSLDVIRVQDQEIAGEDDQIVLAWAAMEGRILLTHDQRTIPHYGLERLTKEDVISGIVVVGPELSIGSVIEDLLVIASCSTMEEWTDRIEFLPL